MKNIALEKHIKEGHKKSKLIKGCVYCVKNKPKLTESEIVREIADILNDMGHPCCRCIHCQTCKKAEEIYNIVVKNL